MKPKTTGACGDSSLLPARQRLQLTDRCSNNESTQFGHAAPAGGSKRETRAESSDASEQHGLREAEEDSFTEPSGSDSDTQPSTLNEPQDSTTFQSDAVHTASSTNEQTTLLECIKATAENSITGVSREVLIFFDSGSTRSFVSTELALDLSLRQLWAGSHRVNTFGSELPTTVEGFSTSVVLRSKHRRIPPLALTTQDHLVSSIRTALVGDTDLPKLRGGELNPSPIQATPDILIGQDLVSHFKRQYGPTLPSGVYVVNSILGPMLGGSGNVLPTVSAAASSSSAVTSASVARRPSRLSEATHPSPTLPMNPCRKRLTAPSAEKCAALASKSNSAETDPDAPSVATYQDFSLPFEKNEFSRSTMSTASCTKRRLLSSRAEGPPPQRKHPNPLDTTVPLPPSYTIHVTLHPELSADPCILTSCDPVYDCGPQDRAQQNPALNNTRKTRLRRRSSSLGRPVLGKNHEELRRCEPMHNLLDQSRPTISTSTHAVPDESDPDAHPEHHTFPGAHFPDVVLVAAEDISIDPTNYAAQHPSPTLAAHRNDRAPTRNPVTYSGNRTEPPQLQPAHVRSSFAGPTEPITSTRTLSVPRFPPISKRTTSVPRSQHRPNRLRKPLRGNENRGDLQRSVSSNYTGRTPRSNTTRNQQTNLTAEPPCRKQKRQTATRSQADHGHGMPNSARGDPSRSLTGSKQHSTATTRCASPHSQGRRRPCPANQDAGATAIDRPPIPIIDGFVSKSFAAFLATHQGQTLANPAVDEDLPPQYEFIGCVNHLGVPSSYLPPTKFQPTVPSEATPLALLTLKQLAQEDNILPWKHVLGSTLGVLPPFWEMVTTETCLHLHEEAQSTTYRGMPFCGIGPTGFFVNASSNCIRREYQGQRQSLLRLARIARNAGKCLVLVTYDEPTTGIDLHHDAIAALRDEAQLPLDHPIHLVAYRASAAQLMHWLKTFPNVTFGVEHVQLTSLHEALQTVDHNSELYIRALDLQLFFAYVPQKNLALHSGCPSPHPSGQPGHFQTPRIILKTAELFEQLTGTPKDVLIEESANTLNAIYHLNLDLPNRAITACDGRDDSRGLTSEDLSAQLHVAPGPARRADPSDQRIMATSRPWALETALSADPTAHSLPHVVSPASTCRMCAFCDGPHSPEDCTTYRGFNQRMQRLKTFKRCFICLGEGYPSSTCPERTTTTCRHCHKDKHQPALCRLLLQQDAAATANCAQSALPAKLPAADRPRTITAADAPRRGTATGHFPPVMNHFRRIDQPSTATERVVQAVSRSAKKRSAAIPPPAQTPSSQPQRPHNKRTATSKSGHQVQAPSPAVLNSSSRSKHVKTSNKQRTRKRSIPLKTALSAAKETLNQASHGEKKEHPSRDAKTYHRSKDPHQNQPVTAPIEPIQRADTRCELCAQRHRAERCTSFSSTEKRRQRAQHLWLCFACLDQGHRTEDCPHVDSSSCSLCGCSSHHQALCTKACRLQDEQATRIHLAEAHSTPVVVPAEAYHQLLTPLSGEADSQANVRAIPQSATGYSGPDLPTNLVSPLGERTLLRAAQLIPEQAAVQVPVPTDAELDRTEAPLHQRSKDRPPSMAQKRRARKRKTRKPKK